MITHFNNCVWQHCYGYGNTGYGSVEISENWWYTLGDTSHKRESYKHHTNLPFSEISGKWKGCFQPSCIAATITTL